MSRPRCVGTVLSPRHVLSAASCFCNADRRFDAVFQSHAAGTDAADCSGEGRRGGMGKRRHNYGSPMDTVVRESLHLPYTQFL